VWLINHWKERKDQRKFILEQGPLKIDVLTVKKYLIGFIVKAVTSVIFWP